MKILLLVGFVLLFQYFGISQNERTIEYINLFQNQPIGTPITDLYLIYRTENMFDIKEINDPKIEQYQVLSSIEYKTESEEEYHSLTLNDFIQKFNDGDINPLFLNVKRDREVQIWYRLGNTNQVLIGKSENQLLSEYNQTIKK